MSTIFPVVDIENFTIMSIASISNKSLQREKLLFSEECRNSETKKLKNELLENMEAIDYYSIDDAISYLSIGCFQYQLLFFTGFLWAASAVQMMIITFLVPALIKDWSLHSPADGMIDAIAFAGTFIGNTFLSVIADKYGRRNVVIVSTFACALFGLLSALAPNIYLFLTARFIVGFGIGGSSVSYTLFAEYSPTKLRGKLLIIQQSFWSIGALFSVLLAWLTLPTLDWRWCLILSSIPFLLLSLFYKYVPESAQWLLACGKIEAAEIMLKKVAKINNKILPDGRLRATNSIGSRGRLRDIFSIKYRSTSALLYIAMFMSVFGYYGISFVSDRVFEQNSASNDQYWENIITTASEFPSLIAGVFLLDYIGRRRTMYLSFGIYCASCYLLIIPYIQGSIFGGILCVFIARLGVYLGLLTLYVYFSEYYPTVIRTTALGSAISLSRIAGILTSFVSEDMTITVGMILYGTVGLIACACAFALETETAEKELSSNPENIETGLNLDYKDIENIPVLFSIKKQEIYSVNDEMQNDKTKTKILKEN